MATRICWREVGLLAVAGLMSLAVQASPLLMDNLSAQRDLSAAEPLACVVFDTEMPAQLGLQAAQLLEWQQLERQHAYLYGARCAQVQEALLSHGQLVTTAAMQTAQRGEDASVLLDYQQGLHAFVSGLSDEQRARLGDIARAHRDRQSALEEKLMRHRLML